MGYRIIGNYFTVNLIEDDNYIIGNVLNFC